MVAPAPGRVSGRAWGKTECARCEAKEAARGVHIDNQAGAAMRLPVAVTTGCRRLHLESALT